MSAEVTFLGNNDVPGKVKKKVLIFCDFYLPGFKSGGGMWTVLNLVDRFADRYDFYIVTRNYESKGDTTPYTTVRSSAWNDVRDAKVFYLSKQDYTLQRFVDLVSEVLPHAVFLNSALSMPILNFLKIRRRGLISDVPVILAPCGEFSAGALSIKPLKKRLFLAYARSVGLYKDVIWKASFSSELLEIRQIAGADANIMVAPDLAPKEIIPNFEPSKKPLKNSGTVRFIFLSRLTKKKNLHYFLEKLSQIKEGEIHLDIVGPVEDPGYWEQCLRIIKDLPSNITVNSEPNFVPYEAGLERMMAAHFFVLPTLGENFGYVFLEALAAGTPLLISENTSWTDVDEKNAGWQVRLDAPDEWISAIGRCVSICGDDYSSMSKSARNYAVDWLKNDTAETAMARIFDLALSGRDTKVEND